MCALTWSAVRLLGDDAAPRPAPEPSRLVPRPPGAEACLGRTVSPASDAGVLRRAVLCLVNVERRKACLPLLRRDARLRRAALDHAGDMVRRRYFRHASLEGATFLARIAARGYAPVRRGFRAGENLAWGAGRDGSPQAIVRAWMASPPHRRVLLTRGFRDVGIGIRHGAPVATPEPAATYVAELGRVGPPEGL